MGIVVLSLACVVLVVALFLNQKKHTTQHTADVTTISNLSNQWVKTSSTLEDIRQANIGLNKDLDDRNSRLVTLTNQLTEVSGQLSKTEQNLKATQETITQRDAKIADLESQNQALDQRAADLSLAITNLTGQIDDTQKKLAASEGDKAFLEKELQRLMAEKAELERQFNDLVVLKAQVAKLKEELNISRRLEWIRQGLFARSDQKGGEQLMQKSAPTTAPSAPTKAAPNYDLNVEVSADGTVKVIQPGTNNVTATNPASQ